MNPAATPNDPEAEGFRKKNEPEGFRQASDPDEQELFDLLQQYLEAKWRRDGVECAKRLKSHPELADLLDCMDQVDSLALDAVPNRQADPDETRIISPQERAVAPTVFFGGSSSAPADAIAVSFPRSFDKYELMQELGRGGMGVVYKARQTDLGRIVALKMILANHLASPSDVWRFTREAESAGRLRHPHIVRIHEVGTNRGQHFFSMDFVDGQSFAELMAAGPVETGAAVDLIIKIARAVHYLHQEGLVHRDLKPSNILIDGQGEPYVTDFGLVKCSDLGDERTQSGTIIGTPSYMSPEQAAGKRDEITHLSDVYGLGAILYEALTGRPPFREETPLDTLVQVLEGQPPLPTRLKPQIAADLELICLRCLERNAEDRYPSAAAFADDLERYQRQEAIEARPSGMVPRFRRWLRREPALASRWGALTAAASAISGRLVWHPDDSRYHIRNLSILMVWGVLCFLFQKLSHRTHAAPWARVGWLTSDAILATTLLSLVAPPRGLLCVVYPLMIVASGMFFQVRLVGMMTLASVISFAILMVIHPDEARPDHYPWIFCLVLIVLGAIVAYQVHRVRVLSRFFSSRKT